MKLATSHQMQSLDRAAIDDIGIPGAVLMENAGLATIRQMERCFGPVRGKTVLIFIGPGNNGGDGLVIARHTVQRGGHPLLIYLVSPDKLGGDAGINASIVRRLNLPQTTVLEEDDIAPLDTLVKKLHFHHPVHCLVDALFGTGLKRPLEGRFAAVVHYMNNLRSRQQWPITAVDIPSGLCADSGATLGCSLQADLTVTYGLAKPGHYHHGGAAVGTLFVADIGIPASVVAKANLPGEVLDVSTGQLLQPRRSAAHKGTCGHLLIIAGSEGKTGAAILSAKAALHSGSGLVTLAVPAQLNQIFETALPEAMTVALDSARPRFTLADYEPILELASQRDGLVLGPGLGMDPQTGDLVRKLYRNVDLPMVVDADALNLLALEPGALAAATAPRILTPHPGEMSRMTGRSTKAVQADRLKSAGWLGTGSGSANKEIVTVLKGAGTVVSSTAGYWAVNSSGNSGMAAGGMGDVLSGLLGGLLVQGYCVWDAARIGVYLHGLAADLLAEKRPYGYTASEVAENLPAAAALMQQQ